jgi:hypothetical protein
LSLRNADQSPAAHARVASDDVKMRRTASDPRRAPAPPSASLAPLVDASFAVFLSKLRAARGASRARLLGMRRGAI